MLEPLPRLTPAYDARPPTEDEPPMELVLTGFNSADELHFSEANSEKIIAVIAKKVVPQKIKFLLSLRLKKIALRSSSSGNSLEFLFSSSDMVNTPVYN